MKADNRDRLRCAIDADRDRLCLALGLKQQGARFWCFKCQSDGLHHSTPDLSTEAGFKCFKCDWTGDGFDLVQQICGVDFPKALEIVAEVYGSSTSAKPTTTPAVPLPKKSGNKLHSTVDAAARAAVWKMGQDTGREHRETARSPFPDAEGQVIAYEIRGEPLDAVADEHGKTEKTFRTIHSDGNGWRVGDPQGLWPIYDLPNVAKASGIVTLHEGVKAARAAQSIGLTATAFAHGAQAPQKTDWTLMAGREVAYFPDNDEAGRKCAQAVAEILTSLTPPAIVKIVALPGLPPKGDLYEFVEARDAQLPNAIRAELEQLVAAAPVWTPPAAVEVITSNIGTTGNPLDLAAQGRPLAKTDVGFAERVAYHHSDKAIFQSDAQVWLVWDGKRWRPDNGMVVMRRLVAETARTIMAECAKLPASLGNHERTDYFKFALRCEARDRINAAIELGASFGMSKPLSAFDHDPMTLNVANGTLDLRTGQLRPHRREDYLTKLSPVAFDPDVYDEIFARFIHHATSGDAELEAYLQRAAGYTLTGNIGEKCLFLVFSEKTDTGKTTHVSGMQTTMGDYALTLDFETLLENEKGNGPRYDLAKLRGARLAVASETKAGRRFSAELIKRLTGGDPIRAREIRESSVEFLPTHKLWLCTNHAPNLEDGGDEATWNRLRRVPFNNQIPRDQRDPRIKAALENPESPTARAFLAWSVAGCTAWQRDRLGTCLAVESSTAAYKEETDPLRDFVEDRCQIIKETTTPAKDLRAAYESWCEDNGVRYPLNPNRFAVCLQKHGALPHKGTGGARVWRGISLVAPVAAVASYSGRNY
jgi:putative DNA primase/helicase